MKIKTRETMWAEMKPDCYGGKSCDQIVPHWNIYADGDKQDDYMRAPIRLAARMFPPGTRVVVHEPLCPQCDEPRLMKYPTPQRGSLYADKCDCGFDWVAWTLGEYS